MRTLLTGAGGFIGSAVCEELLARGHDVVGIDAYLGILYPETIKVERIDHLRNHSKFIFIEADLRESDLEPLLHDVDCVINEAALPGLVPSWTHMRDYFECNTIGLGRLLDGMKSTSQPFLIHASTSSVYGEVADGDESCQLRPTSPYGVSKLAAENLIRAYRDNFSTKATILRYFSVYGPKQRPDMAYSIFCDRLIQGQKIQITGDGTQQRSNTYIRDVAKATVIAAEKQLDGEIMNIAGGETIQLLDALQILADEIGTEAHIEFVPARAGDQAKTQGDASRAQRLLGWTPDTPIELGLRSQARQAVADFSDEH